MTTYGAYEKGFLPAYGGLDDQPAMFMPIMASISSALDDERELEKQTKQDRDAMVAQSQGHQTGKPVSLLNGPQPGFAPLTGKPGK